MKRILLIISAIAIATIAVSLAYYAQNSPPADDSPVTISGVFPSNESLISDRMPTIWLYINLKNVDITSLNFTLFIDALDATGGLAKGTSWAQFTLSEQLEEGPHVAVANIYNGQTKLATASWRFTVDTTPPSFSSLMPPNGSTVTTPTAVISAQYSDAIAGIDASSIIFSFNSVTNPSNAKINSSGLRYLVSLPNGTHSASLGVSDLAGNVARVNWYFTVALPPNETAPSASVVMLSKTGYYYKSGSGLPTIVGEVMNNGTVPVKDVIVQGLFMCKDGNVINNDKPSPAIVYGQAEIMVLAPGEVSPFMVTLPSNFPDFLYILSQLAKFDAKVVNYSVAATPPSRDFSFSNITASLKSNNYYNLTAAVTNTGPSPLADLKVVGTFYASAKPITVVSTHIYSLNAGETAYFTIMVEDGILGPMITAYDLKGSA